MGVKSSHNKFKSENRSIDLYIGRVDNDVKDDDIIKYINDNFSIDQVKIEKLNINATNYNAFKLAVN